jgi:hypoxanthine phosphoribosyltransferase
MNIDDLKSNPNPDLARTIISTDAIQSRVKELADTISSDYTGVESIYIIGILKGAFIFLADLTRQLTIPHYVDFMALSSYGKTATSSGEVRLIMDLRESIADRHVLIVEDIVDSGNTLNYLYRTLGERLPASLKTCVLVRKPRQSLDVPIHYLGYEIPDVWVVGYGLDFADTYRTLPFIAELKEEVYRP